MQTTGIETHLSPTGSLFCCGWSLINGHDLVPNCCVLAFELAFQCKVLAVGRFPEGCVKCKSDDEHNCCLTNWWNPPSPCKALQRKMLRAISNLNLTRASPWSLSSPITPTTKAHRHSEQFADWWRQTAYEGLCLSRDESRGDLSKELSPCCRPWLSHSQLGERTK